MSSEKLFDNLIKGFCNVLCDFSPDFVLHLNCWCVVSFPFVGYQLHI